MSLDVNALGRLVKDPVSKTSKSEKLYAQFNFVTDAGARDNDKKRKPLFIDVIAWGSQAETILKYCKKGTQLKITGAVYDVSTFIGTTDNLPHYNLQVTLEKFEFVSSPK